MSWVMEDLAFRRKFERCKELLELLLNSKCGPSLTSEQEALLDRVADNLDKGVMPSDTQMEIMRMLYGK